MPNLVPFCPATRFSRCLYNFGPPTAPPPSPTVPWGLEAQFCLAYVNSPINPNMRAKFGTNRFEPFGSFPDFGFVDPLNPRQMP